LEDATVDLNQYATVVILRLRNMTALDATGLHAMERLAGRLRKSGRTLLLCGAREQPGRFLERAEFVEHVGGENILPNVSAALDRARQINSSFAGLGDEVAADMKDKSL
jgi:SulP family sulfate permease